MKKYDCKKSMREESSEKRIQNFRLRDAIANIAAKQPIHI